MTVSEAFTFVFDCIRGAVSFLTDWGFAGISLMTFFIIIAIVGIILDRVF